MIEDIYNLQEGKGMEIEKMINEEGDGKIEIKMRNGEKVEMEDKVLMLKRKIREEEMKKDM